MNGNKQRRATELSDGLEILERIEDNTTQQMRCNDDAIRRCHKERVSVSGRFGSGSDTEKPGGAAMIPRHKLLSEAGREAVCENSSPVVRCAARGKIYDQLHCPGRPVFSARVLGI